MSACVQTDPTNFSFPLCEDSVRWLAVGSPGEVSHQARLCQASSLQDQICVAVHCLSAFCYSFLNLLSEPPNFHGYYTFLEVAHS